MFCFFQKGSNLAATHSIDDIDIRIDNINNACIPFNFTDTQVLCLLSKFAVKNFENSEPIVEVCTRDLEIKCAFKTEFCVYRIPRTG